MYMWIFGDLFFTLWSLHACHLSQAHPTHGSCSFHVPGAQHYKPKASSLGGNYTATNCSLGGGVHKAGEPSDDASDDPDIFEDDAFDNNDEAKLIERRKLTEAEVGLLNDHLDSIQDKPEVQRIIHGLMPGHTATIGGPLPKELQDDAEIENPVEEFADEIRAMADSKAAQVMQGNEALEKLYDWKPFKHRLNGGQSSAMLRLHSSTSSLLLEPNTAVPVAALMFHAQINTSAIPPVK